MIREVVWKAHETSVEHFWKTLLDLLLRIQDTHNGLSIKKNPYPFNPVIFAICHPTWHCHRHPQDPAHLRSKPRLWWYWVEPWSGWDLWRNGFRDLGGFGWRSQGPKGPTPFSGVVGAAFTRLHHGLITRPGPNHWSTAPMTQMTVDKSNKSKTQKKIYTPTDEIVDLQ